MNITAYIEKLKAGSLTIWLIAVLLVILASRYVKDAFVFLLMKLYQFFIQHNEPAK